MRTQERRPVSEPYGLADWFFGEAVTHGFNHSLDDAERNKCCRADLRSAETLLSRHSIAEIQRRARNYLRAIAVGQLKIAQPHIRGLVASWDVGYVRLDPGFRAAGRDAVPLNVPREDVKQ